MSLARLAARRLADVPGEIVSLIFEVFVGVIDAKSLVFPGFRRITHPTAGMYNAPAKRLKPTARDTAHAEAFVHWKVRVIP